MRTSLARSLAAIALLATGLCPVAVAADAPFPSGPVRFIIPFAPGGSADQLARPLARRLSETWGQPVIVESKPGAGTLIGTDFVAKSKPDGHTFGLVVAGHTINPALRTDMPFDARKDLAGITQLTRQPMVLVVNAKAPYNNLAEFIAYTKKNPGKVTYGSPGNGTAIHLAGELFDSKLGTKMVHVAYKGASAAYTDLMAGQIDSMFEVASSAVPFVTSGKLKILAVTSEDRFPGFTQYPAIAELAPQYAVTSIFGLVAPAATPKPILNKIQADVAAILATAEFKKMAAEGAMEVVGSKPEQFDQFISNEITRWSEVIRAANIKQ